MKNKISKEEIIKKIPIPILNCKRKCATFKYCKFRKNYESPCGLLVKFAENYVETTFSSLRFKDERHIEEYVQSIEYIINFVLSYENWKGLILDKKMIDYWLGYHAKNNSWQIKDFLKNLSQYLDAYETLHDIQKNYQYKIIVEGSSDLESLNKLSFEIDRCYIGSRENFFNIKGGGNIQNLKFLIENFKENSIRSFFVLDEGDCGHLKQIEKLQDVGLINKNTDNFSFSVCFENSFPAEVIYDSFKKVIPEAQSFIDLKWIEKKLKQRKNIVKEIDKILFKKSSSKISDKKIDFAKILTDKLIEFYKLNPKKRVEIISIMRKLNKQICKERKEFFLL